MQELLCFGGHADGRLIATQGKVIDIPVPREENYRMWVNAAVPVESLRIETERYYVQTFYYHDGTKCNPRIPIHEDHTYYYECFVLAGKSSESRMRDIADQLNVVAMMAGLMSVGKNR